MNKIGIENIKIILIFGLSLAQELQRGLEDKKLNFGEIIGFTDDLAAIPSVVEAVKKAPAEFLDLDEEEKEEIHQLVIDEFDISLDHVEMAIEESFGFALDGVRYATRMTRIFGSKNAA